MARPGPEVDCRLEVIGDLVALRHAGASRRNIVAAIAGLIPSLTAFADQLDDDNDPGGVIHGQLDLEVRLLTP